MIAFAYTECGLNMDEFLSLSFYEWSLEVYRVEKTNEKNYKAWESNAVLAREIMATIVNMTPKKTTRIYKGEDFIKLSFDKIQAKEEVRTDEQILNKFPKTLKK
jgi:hypothetical protein